MAIKTTSTTDNNAGCSPCTPEAHQRTDFQNQPVVPKGKIMKNRRQPLVRIAQEIVKPAGVHGAWATTAFFVRQPQSQEIGVQVHTPEEARSVVNRMAGEIGGRVYRGALPVAWRQALSDIPRS